MKLLDGTLHWSFIVAQISTVWMLGVRNWWKGAPAFMTFLSLSALQSLVGAVGYPHPKTDVIWWHYVWGPSEAAVVLAAIAAAAEILFKRTGYGHNFEKLAIRMWAPVMAIGIVGWQWRIGEHDTLWGWFVYAREFAWAGIALMCGILVTFFATPSRDKKPEPVSLARHSQVFTAFILAHAMIAPLVRKGYNPITCQQVFMAITIVCCAAWLTLCCPGSWRYDARTPAVNGRDLPVKPSRA